MTPEPKTCRSCGREITWRKKWEHNWDEIAYCSAACRAHKISATDRKLEDVDHLPFGCRARGLPGRLARADGTRPACRPPNGGRR
jgi:hypothetical protein